MQGASLMAQWFKKKKKERKLACQCKRDKFNPWVWKIPWRKKWQPTPYSCLENPMDRGAWWASPRGRKEPNTTGLLTLSDLDVHLGQRPVQGPPSGGIWRIKGGRDEGVNYRR